MSLDYKVICIELFMLFLIGLVNVFLLKVDKVMLIDVGMKIKEVWNVFEEVFCKEGYKVIDIE